MASRTGQRDHGSLNFKSKKPHFFKVLLRDAIEHGKLKIPAQFVKKYGSEIPSPIFLMVPSGAVWQVELTKSNAEIWMQGGWRQFVEHFSLQLQDFVVFRYEGNGLFNIIIFDKGASEIQYPINSSQAGNLNFTGESQGLASEEDGDTSVEILDDMPPSKKRREKSPLQCNEGDDNSVTESKEVEDSYQSLGAFSSPHNKLAAQKSEKPQVNLNKVRHQETAGSQDTQGASSLRIPGVLESKNPNFKVLVRSCYLNNHCLLLPFGFAKRYMPGTRMVILQVAGRSWHVKLKSYPSRSFLTSGWSLFAKENALQANDICVFELINSSNAVLRVYISKCAG
ncbi:PREDICTED: B3 domain-containing transcription factor VRN1 isoform X3 [Theobroma cacao]|uniref:B3 domain-containing transcription factor VRN1 isoform X3 n=1 Tax=Theobroma cacao TaxID=3641 RepID=A0AB32W6I2_THECC|nr:PREDICTED: B3 domain-containing transcription factor VRN1 isoform X3 [Theobroma cacao]